MGKFIPDSKTAGGHSRYSQEQIDLAKKGVFKITALSYQHKKR